MTVIKSDILEEIKKNKKVKSSLAYEWDKTARTIERWFAENDPMLTTVQSLRVISEETGIPQDQLTAEA